MAEDRDGSSEVSANQNKTPDRSEGRWDFLKNSYSGPAIVTAGIKVQQPVQEKVDPVKEYATAADNWFNLFHFLGQATDRRSIGGVERSLSTRIERANLLKGLKRGRVGRAISEINVIKHDLDAFDRGFLNQGRLQVEMASLGVQESQYVVVELPGKKEALSKPPIFLIPALSGDLNGVRPLVREAALQGRKVITAGYPESFMGKTTDAFAQASLESPNFEPHTTYFKQAIEALVGKEGDFELWGYSTGGGVVQEVLQDPQFQQRVTNAVIIAPGGSVEQSKVAVIKGILHEFAGVIKNNRGIHDTVVAYAKKLPIDDIHKKLRDKIFFSSLFNKVGKKINSWGGVRVKESGKIIVATGRNDQITKSSRIIEDLRNNPATNQFTILDFPQAFHISFLTEAESVVGKIAKIRDNPQASRYTLV